MNTKRSKLFWLSVISIALLSIILSLYNKDSNITWNIPIPDFVKRIIDRIQWRTLSCDANKWNSPLIAKYGVATVLTVDQKGCGKFRTFKQAVAAVPDKSPKPTLIIFDAGVYMEKVDVPKTKFNLIIQGQGYQNTFLAWNDTAASSNGTVFSYSVCVYAPNFRAHDISFKNTAPNPKQGVQGGQAIALRISGDQAAFYNCGFYGFQDTLYCESGRHYFKQCFIEGSTDFVFGNGRSLFEDCTINSVATGVGITGAIAAQQRNTSAEQTGFSFVNCRIVGIGNIWLGRAWGPYSITVFIRTSMSAIINPEGWNNFKDPSRDQKVFFGEHACTGPGSSFKGRVKYAKNLSVAEAKPYMDISYINGNLWLPKG
ncbi:probable pectinesterase 15 [Rutidosis leptorrhynchoides]|uniref:probable pectinesterase 15 n=1 Tax=Rutidosis leptorrhynchoides TaxID=125765 RepID=UPI003A9923C5